MNRTRLIRLESDCQTNIGHTEFRQDVLFRTKDSIMYVHIIILSQDRVASSDVGRQLCRHAE